MKLFRSKDKIDDASIEALPPRRRQKSQSNTYRVGYTIAGESRAKRQDELERAKAHKRKSRHNRVAIAIAVLLVVILIGVITTISIKIADRREAERLAEVQEALTPTVPILDENANTSISGRVKEFVARLEDDVTDYGLEVERVILPFQKAREVHIYLVGHVEYYKMTIDRSSAVQAEDMAAMVKYLAEKEIGCEYVDLRVKGKAYYK